MQKYGKILRGRKDTLARGFNIAGASAPVAPPFRRLWSIAHVGVMQFET